MLLPNKKYDIIYADPPWSFKNYSKKGEEKNANQHYDCMTIKDICKLPVKDISKDNSILFIDEIHTIIGAGATSGGVMDASNLLKPVLGKNNVKFIKLY